MKTIKINNTRYLIMSSLETAEDILLLVKRPKGKKTFLAFQLPDGKNKLLSEMP
jgi:hypothetical protein